MWDRMGHIWEGARRESGKEQAWVPPDWVLSQLLPVLLCIECQSIKKKIMAKVCYIFYSISTTCYSSDEMAETNLIFEEGKTTTRLGQVSMEAGVILTAQFFKEAIQCLKTTDDYLLTVSMKSQSDSVSLRLDDLKVSRRTMEYKSHRNSQSQSQSQSRRAQNSWQLFFVLFCFRKEVQTYRLPFLKRDFKLEICSCFRTHA